MRTRAVITAAIVVGLAGLQAKPEGQVQGTQAYDTIDGAHLKVYVDEQAAMSRRYRDNGHPQFWGRISGTEADAENARWLLNKFKAIGLSDVHEQPFDLPPQWMPRSWSVNAIGGGRTVALSSAQPTYQAVATPPGGLDLEAVDVGFATDGDLAGRDLRGKAVFFTSTDYQSRHGSMSHNAVKRIGDKGAAAIFVTLLIPGNLRFQFYPVDSPVPTFALGYDDWMTTREMIGQARAAGGAARIQATLAVDMTPNLKTSMVWGTLRGTTDETVYVIAHRDGWFEAANDNGTGVATLIGLAEYFAKVSPAQRRRTIVFLGTSGHHDMTRQSGGWLAQHKELFARTALIINCEHTSQNLLIGSNDAVIRKADVESPMAWYVGGSAKLEQIVRGAFRTFEVKLLADRSTVAGGEILPLQNLAPAMQLIDTGPYWHSDHETPDFTLASGLSQVTRAFAQIIVNIDAVPLADLQRPR